MSLREGTVLIVVDFQEAFRSAIPDFAMIAAQISLAVRGAAILDIPVVVTEQYPAGLGSTVEEILFALSPDAKTIEKRAFSALEEPTFVQALDEMSPKSVLLCGIETHVCIYQTARDIVANGFEVHVLTDCVGSRYAHDKKAGLDRMLQLGAIPSSVEMALFEVMESSAHPKFKDVQSLIK